MFLYILFASGTCAITAAGLLYTYDKRKAETMFYSASWSILTLYATLENLYERNFKKPSPHNKKTDEKFETVIEKISEKITFYDPKIDKYETTIEILDRDDLEWGFVKKNIDNECKCRIYDNINERVKEDEFVIVDKPFLQVELEQNEKKKEIHEHLHYFYLKDNKLFDKKFLKWYLNYWYQINLEDDYTLNIIDHEINIINLDPTQYIVLGEKGNYSIKK